jgi:hypothetical protein
MKSRVFISYTSADVHFAHSIQDAILRTPGATVIDLFNLSAEDSISASISNAIAASDFMIILVSPDALHAQWMIHEMETLTSIEWQQRAITVIPVKVRPCVVPQYLSRWPALDLTRSFERGLEQLVAMVQLAPAIDLSRLNGFEFENLIYELLRAYRFRKIRHGATLQDRRFDFIAEYQRKDPFGRNTTEQWVIEAKASRNRTDISTLNDFIGSFSYRRERHTALFVTATQLTSAAKEWIESLQKENAPRLIVLEGTDIVRLLLEKPKVAEKFFPREGI